MSAMNDDETETLQTLRLSAGDAGYVTAIARWRHEQWGYMHPETSFEEGREQLKAECGAHGVPSVFMALEGERLVGTASLVEDDMSVRRELSPWLASVFVSPECRGQGIASRLVRRVEQAAREAGVSRLYLFTPDQQALYRRLGWQDHERLVYCGEDVTLMTRELAGDAP